MKLVIDNQAGTDTEEFERLFAFISKREGIEAIDKTVALELVAPWGVKHMDVFFQILQGADGGTSDETKDGSIRVFVDVTTRDPLETFAHEMVHVSDHATGRLQHVGGGGDVWLGQYRAPMPYEERPWEIKAYAEAPVIMKEYRNARTSRT